MVAGLDVHWCVQLFHDLEREFSLKEKYLCELDAAVGDGDHGASMLRGFREANAAIGKTGGSIAEVFGSAGMTFLSKVGGVTGVIFGQLFISFSRSLDSRDALSAADIKAMFARAEVDIAARGKVKKGDKSMFDPLTDIAAATGAADTVDVLELLNVAEDAAGDGMHATADMTASVGRARYQGENARGHIDAGAASLHLIVSVMRTAAANLSSV